MGNQVITTPYQQQQQQQPQQQQSSQTSDQSKQFNPHAHYHQHINADGSSPSGGKKFDHTKHLASMGEIPSECPMHASKTPAKTAPPSPSTSSDPHANIKNSYKAASGVMSSGECPIKHEKDVDPLNMMPPPNQQPSPGQPFPLSTKRVQSTIPKADTQGERWTYPSEQMFWNAMLRKGWRWEEDAVKPDDMTAIIHIHNANNEKAWGEVLKWEALHYE
jgi:cytochrome c heme-lyase